MRMIIAVGIGGAVGTLLRFGVAQDFNDPVFPFGTLMANWTGCLGLAWLNEQRKISFSPVWQKGLGTGLLGAYTTFSTLCVEAHLLPPLLSLFYIVATTTGGLLFARLGVWLAQRGKAGWK
ncbi:CrcB family protein [Thermoactinomyces sp. CICC 23799]|uniref:fluoride efflux transporter FluC n=1 Tax=Thermoactinomyces sp. CICC 23799 TaxID=2767429 RepID=UPI0018DB1912|nr:CrcB family protein [Thermoactinomyces sp. CICC 23799]MBH8602463.1 CrcB family protein [Thermoactinomyces sp. CICC 23799]